VSSGAIPAATVDVKVETGSQVTLRLPGFAAPP
jgi:hypothetical protein